jgi:hypothetical protein
VHEYRFWGVEEMKVVNIGRVDEESSFARHGAGMAQSRDLVTRMRQ